MLTFLHYSAYCTRYSILMSGSKGYSNYRHQSDVMKLSKMLHDDESNIVTTMVYDDIAWNKHNPNPGEIYNDHTYENVYNKSYIDYSGEDINFKSFERVLLNLPLTKNDTLLIYYNDHGAPGLLCIPKNRDPTSREMYADDISEVLMKIHDRVESILFIIESCYSGSIAQYITNIPNILVISAASAIESSYSTKWDDSIGASLSNLFTSILFKYISHNNTHSIKELFNHISMYNDRSHANMLGNLKLLNRSIQTYFGIINPIVYSQKKSRCINSQNSLKWYYLHHHNRDKYHKILQRENTIRQIINRFNINSFNNQKIKNFTCYKTTVNIYKQYCSSINEAETKLLLPRLITICDHFDMNDVINTIKSICEI